MSQLSRRRQLRVYQPNGLRVDEVPVPAAGPSDALIRVAACGICGTDLGYLAAGGLAGPTDRPMPLGHEFAGIVEQVGTDVTGLCPGMRVTVDPDDNAIGNGGNEGAFSQWVLVRNARLAGNIHALPDDLPFELGALVEPLSVSLHGVNRARVTPDHKVVVLGAGMIGLGILIHLRRRGVRDVVVVDRIEHRLEMARRFGARATINPSHDDLRGNLSALHGERIKYGFPTVNTDIFIDAAGSGALLQDTLQICPSGGRIVVVAVHHQPVALDLVMLMAKEIELLGSIAYPGDEFQEVIGMLAAREVDVAPLVTHRFPLAEAQAAFAQAGKVDEAIKVMVAVQP